MFHHNERGEVENGEVRFQLKATSQSKLSRDGTWISQRVETRDLRYWYFELFPVVIVVYEAQRDRAFWLHIQDYIDRNPAGVIVNSCVLRIRRRPAELRQRMSFLG